MTMGGAQNLLAAGDAPFRVVMSARFCGDQRYSIVSGGGGGFEYFRNRFASPNNYQATWVAFVGAITTTSQ